MAVAVESGVESQNTESHDTRGIWRFKSKLEKPSRGGPAIITKETTRWCAWQLSAFYFCPTAPSDGLAISTGHLCNRGSAITDAIHFRCRAHAGVCSIGPKLLLLPKHTVRSISKISPARTHQTRGQLWKNRSMAKRKVGGTKDDWSGQQSYPAHNVLEAGWPSMVGLVPLTLQAKSVAANPMVEINNSHAWERI
jgi:hypothetical protein